MSIINKVLRDLDSRAAEGDRPAATLSAAGAGVQMPPGVVAVSEPRENTQTMQRRRSWRVPLLLCGVLGIGAGLWWWNGARGWGSGPVDAGGVGTKPQDTAPAAAARPPLQAVPAPAAAAGVQASAASAPEPLFPAGMARPEVLAPLRPPAMVSPPSTKAPVPPTASASPAAPSAAASLSSASPVAVRPLPSAPTTTSSTAARGAGPVPAPPAGQKAPPSEMPPVAVPTPQPWPEAAMDAVGQAQRMWSSGARDTALAFLRDAWAGVERAHGPDLAPDRPGAAAGLAMLRELVRMEQVMAHHAQVLALLQRHEGLYTRQADLWALRGSAAQRLSQHAEAAESYRAALRLRSGEPRWMLGAAVSLAAQGQVAEAAQWVEQARAIGPVSPEVLSYLRQLGVSVRSDNQRN